MITRVKAVRDGQSVFLNDGVYGGMNELPVIGNLFRNKSRSKSKAELLIFVTPKVMRVSQR